MPEVGDQHGIWLRQASCLSPERRPHLADPQSQQRRAPGLPRGPHSVGRIEGERNVALDDIVAALAQSVDKDAHARLLPQTIGPEDDDPHFGYAGFLARATRPEPRRVPWKGRWITQKGAATTVIKAARPAFG